MVIKDAIMRWALSNASAVSLSLLMTRRVTHEPMMQKAMVAIT